MKVGPIHMTEIILMNKPKFETYIIINSMAYSIDRLPWYKRWFVRTALKLGFTIDAI